jgi:hypothetical protein
MLGAQALTKALVLAIAAHGLSSDALTPWRGWLVFKEFVREAVETPDPGVSVQITRSDRDGTVSLIFVRQVVEVTDDWLHPTGGVVCELTFPQSSRKMAEWEAWSFEAPGFERFVDLVECSASFQELVVSTPLRSSVYWLEM